MQHREDNNEFEWFYTSHLDSLFPSSVSYTAPSLPQLVTTNKGVDEKEKKRKERMEKNRVIARNCRKRKKAKLTAMETELAQLKSDKRDLELKVAKLQQLSAVTEVSYDADNTPVLPTREARNKQYRTINKLLGQYDKQKAKQEDTAAVVAEIQRRLHICEEMHSDFGKARKSEIGFHMNQLETLLIPNQLTKLSLWSLQQEDDFYDEATNTKTFGGGLWNTICQEFNLTADQKSSLLSMRDSIRDQRKNIYECLKILHELKSRVHTSFEQLRTQMIKIVKVTSPVQQARFLMWIESNQPCMSMLNSLWEQDKEKKHRADSQSEAFDEGSDSDSDKPQEVESTDAVRLSTEEMEAALKTGKTAQAMKDLIQKQFPANSM